MILTQKPNQSDKQIYNIIMYNHNKTAIGTNIIILNDLGTNDWYIYSHSKYFEFMIASPPKGVSQLYIQNHLCCQLKSKPMEV
jgi:hypothetical protein